MKRISDIPLSNIMVANPKTVDIETPFSQVEILFRKHRIRHLPVVDEKMFLHGIITQTDLYRTVAPIKSLDGDFVYSKEALDRYILKYVMTKEVISLSPEDSFSSAMEIMVRRRYGCVPIVDDENILVGIITQIDILKTISKYAGWLI